jgi:hypothetical protein
MTWAGFEPAIQPTSAQGRRGAATRSAQVSLVLENIEKEGNLEGLVVGL